MAENQKHTIFLVDDDESYLKSLQYRLMLEYEVLIATSVTQAKNILSKNHSIDAVISDLDFNCQPLDGIDLIDWILEENPAVPIIVFSGDKVTERVMNAGKRKLIDSIPKSSNLSLLEVALRRAISHRQKILDLRKNPHRFKTRCPRILKDLTKLDFYALKESTAPILILGESGVGKDILANHIASIWKKPLISANMANIKDSNVESELFGHLKGSFTGAISDKMGLMERAHRGFFFMDEIAECSMEVQAALLRALNSPQIRRMGAVDTKTVDVQWISATNKNLTQQIQLGLFRLDLFQRLRGLTIRLPPLRERPEDIELYLNEFILENAKKEELKLDKSGLEAALNYSWPGNVRELFMFVKTVAEGPPIGVINRSVVEEWIESNQDESSFSTAEVNSVNQGDERERLIQALARSRGNRTVASEMLGIDRSTLYRKLKQYGLEHMVEAKPGRPYKEK